MKTMPSAAFEWRTIHTYDQRQGQMESLMRLNREWEKARVKDISLIENKVEQKNYEIQNVH